MGEYSSGEHIGRHLQSKRFTLRPRFTIVHHPIREKFGLSLSAYAVIDSIHQLSHRPDHPWCTETKERLADFLSISRRSVFNAIEDGMQKGLLEKNDRGDLRSSNQWIEQVVLYDPKAQRR